MTRQGGRTRRSRRCTCALSALLSAVLVVVTGTMNPNAVITKIGLNGDVCIYNSQAAHVIADVTGYFP